MNTDEALSREKSWSENPRMRPQPGVARAVAYTFANRVRQLEAQLEQLQRLVVGRQILIERGNPNRGPGTGQGFGRRVPAVIEEVMDAWQVRCKLLSDDPDAVSAPSRAGDSGLWSVSQIINE